MKQLNSLCVLFIFCSTISTYAGNYSSSRLKADAAKYDIHYEKQVNHIIAAINPDQLWDNLGYLTTFPDRHQDTDTGVKAAMWIKSQAENMIKQYKRTDAEVTVLPTDMNYAICVGICVHRQPSIVLKLGTSNEPGVVLGAHMDTYTSLIKHEIKPGAEDNASGVVTVMETARTILASDYRFNKPIYFVWYAAEEGGPGSEAVIYNYFKKNNRPVSGVINFDETGYPNNNDPTIYLADHIVDTSLTMFLEKLIINYVKVPIKYIYSYDNTDSEEWNYENIPVVQPADGAEETNLHPDDPVTYIHESNDTIDKSFLNSYDRFH